MRGIHKLQELDLQLNWHPCSQMKDYELFKPLTIKRARGSYLELTDGTKIIDAISSWWCKSLGHNHPTLKKALLQQIHQFEHVIFANTTNDTIVKLSEVLTALTPHLKKVFYAGDGSCAVEIALKMSLHIRFIEANHTRKKFIALKNAYHGETLAALSVSDLGLYRRPYEAYLFSPYFITPPYVLSTDDPLWQDASEPWARAEKLLEPYQETATAIILEPILQGAAGMKIYSQDFLNHLAAWAKKHNIHLIADEIMTGLGRTGKMLACEHANIQPDFVCLSKGLTSGWMSFSAVLTTDDIYRMFYDDYDTGKAFLHSHTYSGNPLAASVALATLDIIKKECLCERATHLQTILRHNMNEVAQVTGQLNNIRGIGGVIAADLFSHDQSRRGYQVFRNAVKLGAFLRPLGNTIYWLPPLTISEQTLEDLKRITIAAISLTYS